MRALALLLLVPLLAVAGCGDDGTPEIWIYTSLYPEVIEEMEPALKAEFPNVRFKWLQKGSELVAVRLNTELAAGDTKCDLLVTSDPFYYLQLKEAGELLAYETDATQAVPDVLKDPDGAFCTVRIPVMVMAVRKDLEASARPRMFSNLAEDRFEGRVTMGDPLKSGTNFTTVAALSTKYGWRYYEELRKGGILAAGGNSAVLRRLESGERAIGVILLENLLARGDLGADNPILTVFPSDGAIPVPSPIAIMKRTEEPDLAKRVYDFFFSEKMQAAIVNWHMYSPLPAHAPPKGAPAWSTLKLYPWTNAFLRDVKERRDAIKERWRQVMR
ncbi:MAG: extracellular solute-binding protein [Planctomycetota bacterium]|nr:extracellular solute-binding protein [Planctomycetota bacterium]